ncbi:MAG: ankyrin repeat domain-containing protein, partial [Gammaproteobacteria bacterium]|nr:ankyrin repeat domain-containing protein [Gammaproteobacteria bacterium]
MFRIRELKIVAGILILAFSNFALAQSDIADAAMERNEDLVRILLEDGADVNAVQSDG